MTKSKTQHRGHCQHCGREHAVGRYGYIVKHGYTVEQGFFDGICPGYALDPVEVRRDRADHVVAVVRASVAGLKLRAEQTLAGLADPATYTDYWKKSHDFPSADQYTQTEVRESLAGEHSRRARAGEQFADYLAGIIKEFHGKPLVTITRSEPAPRVKRGDRRGGVRVLVADYQDGAKVYYHREGEDDRQYSTSSRCWRSLPEAE